MRMPVLWLVVLALLIPARVAGQSIHPFFQQDDLVFKPELVGTWNISDDQVEFRDLGDKTYGAVLRDGGQSDAQIMNVKESRAAAAADLDHPTPEIQVSDRDFELDNEDAAFINHQHLLLRVTLEEDKNELQFSFLEEDWVETEGEAGKLSAAHTKDDTGHLLFIAESDDLHAWVRELPDEAFEKPSSMKRAETDKAVSGPGMTGP